MGFALTSDLIASSEHPVIVGLGATGLSCARYFARQGTPFSVVDTRAQPPGLESLRALAPEAEVILGEIPADRLLHAGRLVVSPGLGLDLAEGLSQRSGVSVRRTEG